MVLISTIAILAIIDLLTNSSNAELSIKEAANANDQHRTFIRGSRSLKANTCNLCFDGSTPKHPKAQVPSLIGNIVLVPCADFAVEMEDLPSAMCAVKQSEVARSCGCPEQVRGTTPDEEKGKCTLCYDGSAPTKPYAEVFSPLGNNNIVSCGVLYSEIASLPTRFCAAEQKEDADVCGCPMPNE